MKSLPPLPSVNQLLKIYNLSAKQKLSQNFILDQNVTDKIVRLVAGSKKSLSDSLVVEVGPGPGLLTRSLLAAGATNVVAIEKDPRFLPTLNQLAEATDHRLKIIQGDVLQTSASKIFSAAHMSESSIDKMPIHIAGNLPFGISTVLLFQWLHNLAKRDGLFKYSSNVDMVLMFQKEVAQRITASPQSPERSRLSVMTQSLCSASLEYIVPGKVFVPPPKVDAGVVKLIPLEKRLLDSNVPYAVLETILRHAFNQRRKTIKNSLRY
ncbi:S-adenosyl-L-methionine-dependent methyltransferase [Paraphysoderma sedebokerense]|nr:S-adenosyl-L-methionine-dependent methyltransferase [Paraphysoderma sedebokerense]